MLLLQPIFQPTTAKHTRWMAVVSRGYGSGAASQGGSRGPCSLALESAALGCDAVAVRLVVFLGSGPAGATCPVWFRPCQLPCSHV
jgi:hypothetical protein